MNISGRFRGSFDARIRPPTSERYRTCVTEITATMNLVILHASVPAISIEGVNMSTKPTIMVDAASLTSGP